LSGLRNRRFVLVVGLLALGALPAEAQTQLDEGKTPPQLFSSVCSGCHRSPRGLTKETSASTLASFLRAHYTTGREQAAVLAAYVLQAGAGEARGQQPPPAARAPDAARVPDAARAPDDTPRPPRPTGQAQAEPSSPGDARRTPRAEEPARPAARLGSRARVPPAAAPPAAPEPPATPPATVSAVPGRTDDIAD
jgi:hypothetical protein